MATTATIEPVTRIEGHLSVHTETEPIETETGQAFRATSARCAGQMFRGFEKLLVGRDPLDAQQITQRICGVCPISHATASIRAQEMAYGIRPSHNGRLLQNLVLAGNFLQSHILHFYHLAALDFVDVTSVLSYSGSDRTLKSVRAWVETAIAREDMFAAAPFLPRDDGDYVRDESRNAALLAHYLEALDIRAVCHEMAAVFGARLPHSTALVPGGCTQVPTMERIVSYASRLKRILAFIDEAYIPDLQEVAAEFPQYLEIGGGYRNYLAYGVFEMDDSGGDRFIRPGAVVDGTWEQLDVASIAEDVAYSRYENDSAMHPSRSQTRPAPNKGQAYSWIKAPRYKGHPMEVGPLARVVVNYLAPGDSWIKQEVDAFLTSTGLELNALFSVLGRHVARGLECRWIARQALKWLDEIEVGRPAAQRFDIPQISDGYGLTEAPRGALGHWLSIADHHIRNYQCVVPTTWNCSPRDSRDQPGPVEKAIEGALIADPSQPIEVGRIVRSFDPCTACAVH